MSRIPKTLKDFMHWKGNNYTLSVKKRLINNVHTGSELQAWILYFSLPVLKEILPLPYLQHLSLLVGSLQIFNADCITPEDMTVASALLAEFYTKFPQLYGNLPHILCIG